MIKPTSKASTAICLDFPQSRGFKQHVACGTHAVHALQHICEEAAHHKADSHTLQVGGLQVVARQEGDEDAVIEGDQNDDGNCVKR